VLPGITELLDRLSARDDVELALVTGNYEPVARLKLGASRYRLTVRRRTGGVRIGR